MDLQGHNVFSRKCSRLAHHDIYIWSFWCLNRYFNPFISGAPWKDNLFTYLFSFEHKKVFKWRTNRKKFSFDFTFTSHFETFYVNILIVITEKLLEWIIKVLPAFSRFGSIINGIPNGLKSRSALNLMFL